ncbi:LysR substrate-binding domain-containing protein [Paucibacter sp. KBW04]|uniref:LysR substrate-binding domain-containing protein n=1 Tax=Paucibacter sp. KBW04 TaxID=2153361 RepID=UPI001E46BE0E|nr:LysR substrate-binding domain-containing protein [Paucibacter sp. KBW04]
MPAEQQKLKVLLLSSVACTWLMPRLPAFALAMPHITLSLETAYEVVSLPPLQAMVAIRFGHFARAGLRCQRLWFDHMVAVAAPSWVEQHGLDADHWPTTQMLQHSYEPWPQRLPTQGEANTSRKLAAAEGFEFNDALLLVQAALLGCGVAWVRSSLVQDWVTRGQLQVLAQSEQVSDKAAWLVCREDTADLPAVRDFFRWVMTQAATNDQPE